MYAQILLTTTVPKLWLKPDHAFENLDFELKLATVKSFKKKRIKACTGYLTMDVVELEPSTGLGIARRREALVDINPKVLD